MGVRAGNLPNRNRPTYCNDELHSSTRYIWAVGAFIYAKCYFVYNVYYMQNGQRYTQYIMKDLPNYEDLFYNFTSFFSTKIKQTKN